MKNPNFDKIVNEQYGFRLGKKDLVIIKTGKGGSIYGYEGKYLNLSEYINNTFGYHVAVSANPVDSSAHLETEINDTLAVVGPVENIYYIGISDGALVGAQQAFKISQIKKMLLINGPLMINWPKTRKGLEQFEGEGVEMCYGTLDPSYGYIEILKAVKSSKVKVTRLEGVDHNFKNNYESLQGIIESFLGF